MRLDELNWVEVGGDEAQNWAVRWAWVGALRYRIYERTKTGLYDIHAMKHIHGDAFDHKSTKYTGLDPITAQAVIYKLTQGGNDAPVDNS